LLSRRRNWIVATLETLLSEGKVRAIGVSNFMPEHITRLLAEVTVVPAVNQIEMHPYFQQAAPGPDARATSRNACR
jgi:diketogulonate reductase-like aldo/keto reductase